jgi:hypothetical protein
MRARQCLVCDRIKEAEAVTCETHIEGRSEALKGRSRPDSKETERRRAKKGLGVAMI